jgi:ribA/ribD-fused uncharacterized protein
MDLEMIGAKRHREDFMVNGIVVPEVTDTGIYGLFGEYRCLSNFHMHPVHYDGLTYACSEAAYMAQKTFDMDLRRKFASLTTAKEAKQLGRKVELRPDWDSFRVHAMYRVLIAKFSQDLESLGVLMNTKGKYIEETNWWGDRFWGKCGGEGENNLGQILMSIREWM